jgi:BolA protein
MSMENWMCEVLNAEFAPLHLEIINDSAAHAGHNAHAKATGETHFTVVIVSEVFAGLSRVARHQRVYALLKSEMEREGGLHALVIQAYTPEEAKTKLVTKAF